MTAVICVMEVVILRYVSSREKTEIWVNQWKYIRDHFNHSKIAFILGVWNAKGHPEHLLLVADPVEAMSVPQMVRKSLLFPTALSWDQHFPLEVAASVEAKQILSSASAQEVPSCC